MVEVGTGRCRDAQGKVPKQHSKYITTKTDCNEFCLANEKWTGAAYCSVCFQWSCNLYGTRLTKDNTPDGWYFGNGTGSDVITQADGYEGWFCSRKTTPPAPTTPGAMHTPRCCMRPFLFCLDDACPLASNLK